MVQVVAVMVLFAVAGSLGLATALVPWWWLVAAAVVPVFLALAWAFPELAAVGLVAAVFGVLPDFLLPSIPVGGGRLNAEDLGIPLLLCLLIVKHARNLGPSLAPLRPYVVPLGTLIFVAALSALLAVLYKTAPVKDVLNESRPYFVWLMFPILCLSTSDEQSFRRLLYALFALALVLAIGVTTQSFTGITLFGKGQEVRALYTLGGVNRDVLRSTTPGMFVMAGALVFCFAAYAKEQIRRPVVLASLSAVLGCGLLVGFGRGMWLSVFIGVLLLALYSRKASYSKLVIMLLLASSVGAAAMLVLKPEYADAFVARLFSVTEEIESGSSFGRRTEENHYAMQRVMESPILGVGLGGRYKPDNKESLVWEAQSRYIHNAYMNVLVKTGVPGLLAALLFVAVAIRRSWGALRHPSENQAVTFAAFWVILTTTVFTSITQPNFVAANGVASICIALYLSERLRKTSSAGSELVVGRGA